MDKFSNNIHLRETETRKLGYTEEFKNWIHEHPGAINIFKELSEYIIGKNGSPLFSKNPVLFDEAEATILVDYFWEDKRFIYLKLKIDNETFFIKSEGIPFRGKGFEEFRNTHEVKEKLKGIKARVIDYQLGYEDVHGKSYFISRWDDNIISMRDTEFLLRKEIKQNESLQTPEGYKRADEIEDKLKSLEQRVAELKNILKDYHDLGDTNIFYDQQNDEMVLLDLFKRPQNLY